MRVRLSAEAINPWQLIQEHQTEVKKTFGATSIFIGTMRDYNESEKVQRMRLDYYPGMTEKELEKIAAEACQKWRVQEVLIAHRVGEIIPDDTLVVVAVWASHRGDACDACRYLIEELKASAPFWKKEWLASGEVRWVEKNTDGYSAARD